jgi:uncharacterized protein YndB with AHSA1/START domain
MGCTTSKEVEMSIQVPDRIDHEVVVEAPPERVWAIVTEPAHVAAWFGDSAEIDLRPGGDMTLHWKDHGSFLGRVEQVDPPRLFSFRWARPADVAPAAGNATLVEFTLTPEGPNTRLRVVESGFRDLDLPEAEQAEHAVGNQKGWAHELGELVEYAAERVGASR